MSMAYRTVPRAQVKVERGQEKKTKAKLSYPVTSKTKAKSPLCQFMDLITQNRGHHRVVLGPKRLEALSSLSTTDVGRRGAVVVAVASCHRCLSWET
jgi:hypothetical protein